MNGVIKRIHKRGISLKIMSKLILALSLIITFVLIFATVRALLSFFSLERSTDYYIELEQEASKLMEASDYLTEQVQRYTVIRDRRYLDSYFTEVLETRRREAAIQAIEEQLPDSLVLYELNDSMNRSSRLMIREYYAMVLVLDALEDPDIPEALQDVVLTEQDALLSPDEKLNLAAAMVHDTDYYSQKNEIRRNLNDSLEALKTSAFTSQQGLEGTVRRALISVVVLILVQSASIWAILWLHSQLGLKPVLRAVEHIKKDESIPAGGASEFRYLASAYNAMFSAHKKSIANLNYKASHDELTGAYNRAGYDVIKNNLDMTSTALMIIDADKFKEVNDTYGHETGDAVLKKVASVLKKYFRSDDYVCRVGGDEFVVLMVSIPESPDVLIKTKIDMIRRDLINTKDGLPRITLSIGVAYDHEGTDPDELFRRADAALYHVKNNGRSGCAFYSDGLKNS